MVAKIKMRFIQFIVSWSLNGCFLFNFNFDFFLFFVKIRLYPRKRTLAQIKIKSLTNWLVVATLKFENREILLIFEKNLINKLRQKMM